MQRYYETVIDTLTGAAVKNAEVWVFNAGDNSLATIFTDAAGALPHIDLPLLSDLNGYFEFYAADGLYTFEYRANGTTFRTIENVAIFDLSDMRVDVDALLAEMPLKAAITYVDTGDAALAAAIAALDADVYRKASVYTKVETDAAIVAVPRYYSFGAFAPSNIQSSEILLDHVVAVANTLPADFANMQVSVGAPPAATWAADVQRNGVSIGTISISNTGVVTKTTTGGTAKALAISDVVSVVAPATPDAAITRLRFTFRGVI